MTTAVLDRQPAVPRPHRGLLIVLCLVAAVGLIFVAGVALPYFLLDQAQFRSYWPRRWWLLLHISTGIVALLTGPVQLWLGITDRLPELHRKLGTTYLLAVLTSSMAAFYLAFHTDLGWMISSGLIGLAIAWLTTSGMAYTAIRRHLIEQHKEWMIRSYVVTTAFVTFRVFYLLVQSTGVGTPNEQLGIASWFCWAVPLLVTEAWLQGRKILAVRAD
jgi:uncharacterized membrane protein